jgi:hypothetical protein
MNELIKLNIIFIFILIQYILSFWKFLICIKQKYDLLNNKVNKSIRYQNIGYKYKIS